MSAKQLIEQEDIIVRSLLLFDPARGGQIPDGSSITEKPQQALRVAQIGESIKLSSRDTEWRNKSPVLAGWFIRAYILALSGQEC